MPNAAFDLTVLISTSELLGDAGSSYLAACKRILVDVTEAERIASGEYTAPTGELTVTAPISLGHTHLTPSLRTFSSPTLVSKLA